MFLKKAFLCCIASMGMTAAQVSLASELDIAANSINALGLDLLPRVAKPNENALISPYSIQSALAMTYAGAAGETKAEMAKVLHYPKNEEKLHLSFSALEKDLPTSVETANRLYLKIGFQIRPEFQDLIKEKYDATLQELDFINAPAIASDEINHWVAERTHGRIQDVVSPEAFSDKTRLVVVNAVYFKASWTDCFEEESTKNEEFFVGGTRRENVKTMFNYAKFGYQRTDGITVVTLPYADGELQLLILLPDKRDGLAALEASLTPKVLDKYGQADPIKLILHLPKFRIKPASMPLSSILKSLGMRQAFNEPLHSANFQKMAEVKPNEYLYISEVIHKTFIEVSEEGTEAAAATAEVMTLGSFGVESNKKKPIEVRVDRPFLFAIQHRSSGACLFLGRVVDPR